MSFPNRETLTAFGPTLTDARAVRNPNTELSAQVFNLLRQQVAGMNLLSPRALVIFTAANPPVLVGRVEAWNPNRLTTGPHANPVLARENTGIYTVTWTSPTLDGSGASSPVVLEWCHGFTLEATTPVLKHVRGAVLASTPNSVRVHRWNSANALEDGGTLAVFVG